MTPKGLWLRLLDASHNLLATGHLERKSLPTQPLPSDAGLYNLHIIGPCEVPHEEPARPSVSVLGRCLLCGLYFPPEVQAVHFANCHPEVPFALGPVN